MGEPPVGLRYRAAGSEDNLAPHSPLLHFDEHDLPIHGIPSACLAWEVIGAAPDRLTARLDCSRPDLGAVFPAAFRIRVTERSVQ